MLHQFYTISFFAFSPDRGPLGFTPQTNLTRVRLKAYKNQLEEVVSVCLFGPLLVCNRVWLVLSHLTKQIVLSGNGLWYGLNGLNEVGVKSPLLTIKDHLTTSAHKTTLLLF